ncbi:AMP-dependent synthetase/ligase [Ornithinimicrobium cryptoxanthini]|uniref:Acyl-CoA synthetase n=1 Tax=Ornithinimicrobium cryptoxanthini TaxID=2934161 RepID=A0ABY4YJH6_9MICO|nr:AMP-binding protein [Ornithinimicrobium cryptoxanthini]USQ76400.1 AMP-binding protein [Ornithinimicrobium cryptoxanthini]
MSEVQHLSQLLRRAAAEIPDHVALREKRYGLWRDITWADYLHNVEAIAFGLAALGVGAGDRVAIQSENRPEWLYTDLAANMLRAPIVGIYPTNPVAEVRHLLTDSGARVLVAEDQEQVDKALELVEQVPHLEWVVYLDGRGMTDYGHERLLSVDELVRRGEAHRAGDPDLLSRVDAERTPDDLVTLIYTSGTTGPPKGAMLSARNVDFGAAIFARAPGMFGTQGLHADDVLVSYLPLSHVVERAISTWGGVRNRPLVHFAESIETVVSDLAEVQPTVLFAVPRIWEKIQATVAIRMANASRLKRAAYGLGHRLGTRAARQQLADGAPNLSSRVLFFVAWLLVNRKLRRHLGLAKVRHALSGAAPIAPEVLEFFLSMGVLIHEAYGMTENTAVATATRPGHVRFGTVGQTQPDIELRLDEETGEVLTRHPGNFVGYWHQPEATAEVLDADGWLHTGDVGTWVDGDFLKIIDRIKDIIITAGGKNITPSELENAIKASTFVREAVVIGDQRPYLTALIGIEFDTVADWASRNRIEYTTYKDLSTKPETVELISDIIRDANTRVARVESVRKFRMLHKELDHEDGELTATQKLKRGAFAATVPHLVEDMYAGSTEHAGADLGRSG